MYRVLEAICLRDVNLHVLIIVVVVVVVVVVFTTATGVYNHHMTTTKLTVLSDGGTHVNKLPSHNTIMEWPSVEATTFKLPTPSHHTFSH